MEEIRVHVCKFKRSDSSKPEKGIKIEPSTIIDSNGNVLKKVYSCYGRYELGCFIFRE